MKSIYASIVSAAMLSTLAFVGCSPDEYELGDTAFTSGDLAEGVAYTITHDADNPNIIHLKSLLDSRYTALWEHPQGRSQANEVTLNIPFDGTYNVVFGAITPGGVVWGDTAQFVISDFCADFVSDPLWTYLSGGVGKSKTWIYDNGSYGYGSGEMTYADPSTTVEWGNWSSNWDPGVKHVLSDNEDGTTNAGWASTMTFDLIGGAGVTIHDTSDQGVGDVKGKYMLDADAHTLTFTDATLLHPGSWDYKTTTAGWSRNLKILELDENHLVVAVLRSAETSGEGEWWLVWRYVSQEYAENMPQEETTTVNDPEYTGDAATDMGTSTSTTMSWIMVEDAPYDWYWYDNASAAWQSNGFAALTDYPSWAPLPARSELKAWNLMLTYVSETNGQYIYTDQQGATVEGNYTTEGTVLTFDRELTFLTVSGSATGGSAFNHTYKGNTLRVVKKEGTKYQPVYWLGIPQRTNDAGTTIEYLCLKVTTASTSSGAVPARNIAFNNDNVRYGDLEGNGNLRIQFYNCYGGHTDADAAVAAADIYCDEKIVINFTVSGLGTFASPVTAFIMSSAHNLWSATEGSNTFTFTGDGTYEATITGAADATSDLVYLIDVVGAQEQVQGIDLNADVTNNTLREAGVVVTINSMKADGRTAE